MFEKNNVTITLHLLCAKKEKIYPANVSKHSSNCEKKVIFSMISNGEKRKGKSKGCKAKLKGQRWH